MLFYQCLITGILLLLMINTLYNLYQTRRLVRQATLVEQPLVSILIPARNESRTIAACVESLVHQTYPHLEILVLDDHSEDNTAAIVTELMERYPGVRLLRGQPLPPFWHGKAYACMQLAQAARGQWLLFVDADTVHEPSSLATALQVAIQQNADLLTLMPEIRALTFGEALMLPIIPMAICSLLPIGLTNRVAWPILAGALGPFMLFKRESYRLIGGHEAVRMELVEDMQLGRLIRQHKGRVIWLDGSDLMSIRFYRGWRETWNGIAKSTFTALKASLLTLFIGLLIFAGIFLAPYGFVLQSLATDHISVALFWLPLLQIALIIGSQSLAIHRFHMRRGLAFLNAGTILATIFCTLFSAYRAVFGTGIVWKGRNYRVHTVNTRSLWQEIHALSIGQGILASFIIILGWLDGESTLRFVALLMLLNWTITVLGPSSDDSHAQRWNAFAEIYGSSSVIFYLVLNGQILAWQASVIALLALGCSFRYRWQSVATAAYFLSGGALLLIASESIRWLPLFLLGWSGCILLIKTSKNWLPQMRQNDHH
jgi:chlorobactene glucosyltransferase